MSRVGRLLVLLVVFGFVVTWKPNSVQAYDPPTEPGTAYYVDSTWGEVITFNGKGVLRAYQIGYEARSGTPKPVLLLAFARQKHDSRMGWGVQLYQEVGIYHSNAWVQMVFQRFADGYAANPNHVPATISMGTSNANYPWTCDNNDPGTLSPDWYNAGVAWGTLAKQITVDESKVQFRSGNDMEAWQFAGDAWIACGLGAQKWYEGYESQTVVGNEVPIFNINFGSNGFVERPNQWTKQQVHFVSYGTRTALVYPQIYCPGQAESWVSIRNDYFLVFDGVTATNGIGTCQSGVPMYSWLDAWNQLNNALAQEQYYGYVHSSVANFNYQY